MNRHIQTCFRLLLLAAVIMQAGCQLGRRTFEYSSASRLPWFGLDLRSKPPEKSIRPIRGGQDDDLQLQHADLVQLEDDPATTSRSAPRIPLPRTDVTEDGREVPIDVAEAPDDDGWF